MTLRILKWWPPVICALLFFFLGYVFLPYPGLQNDEVYFTAPLFSPPSSVFRVGLFHHGFPLMYMSYVGQVKFWLFAPILHGSVSYASIRVPALLIGSITTALFFLLAESIHSRRAAWLGSLLLATDAVFLLSTCFDWGPVALQHFLLVLGLLLSVRFAQTGSRVALGWALFVFGLAMWDKALFVWMFSAIIIATIVVYSRQFWNRINAKNIAVGLLAFSLGAFPLILYNLYRNFPTYRSNSALEWNKFPDKFAMLRYTWKGNALFGYLVNGDGETAHPRLPETALERLSFDAYSLVGDHFTNSMEPALLAALLLMPVLWFTRTRHLLLFCVIAMSVAWIEMAITLNAGGAAHHSILLWPMPQLFLAVAFAESSHFLRRAGPLAIAVVTLYLAGENLLVLNQYLFTMVRNGPARSWTDAIYPLSEALSSIPAQNIVINDWGILNPLALINRGTLPLMWAGDPYFPPNASEAERRHKYMILSDPANLWIGHANGQELFPGVNERFLTVITASGYQRKVLRTVSDRNGRPIFEVFRIVALTSSPAPGP